jgi:multidrug efflux pump subunit AcrA (membrane-fusion protein)
MKVFALVLISVVALTGCHSKSPVSGEEGGGTVNLFKQGKGVLLSEETRKLFGIEVAEVAERLMERRVEKSAQVYRAGVGGKPSSALLLLASEELSGVKEGQVMHIKSAKGEKVELPARLVRIDKGTAVTTGQVEGVLEFTDPELKFHVGDFVTASFVVGEAKPALVIPESALLVTAEGSFVYVVNGTHLTRTKIKTGASSEGAVEVEDGLYAGDSVAAKGVQSLWIVELSALKGGTPCCPAPKKT